MKFRADILAVDVHNRPIAVVEIKNLPALAPAHGVDRSAYMRLTTGGVVPYFFLVSQDKAYVWKSDQTEPIAFDMSLVMRRFLRNLPGEERLFGVTIGSLVAHWFSELSAGVRTAEQEPEIALAAIGFLNDIRGASVLAEAIA